MNVHITEHALLRWRQRIDRTARRREIRNAIVAALEPGFAMRRRGRGFEMVMRQARIVLVPTLDGWDIITAKERRTRKEAGLGG